MDLTLTEEQQLIQRTARELLEARSPIAHLREMEGDPTGYSAELWKQMVELGWTALALPEAQGGLGQGFLEVCLLAEELGRHQTPSPFVPTVIHCALAIARFGSDAQRDELLPNVATGERVMSFGDGRGALAATAEEGGVRLDGEVMFVPYAHAAADLVVVAERDGEPVVLVVDAATGGVGLERLDTIRPDHEHRVRFEGARVPERRVLGGGEVAEAALAYGTAAACAEMVGGAQRVLDMTVAYAGERRQFGRPIGSFQAIQHHCANMAIDVLGSRFIAYEAIWRLAEGLDASEEVSLAKAWVSEAYRRVCALGHQVHGAIGFTHEYDLHYYLRHAVSSELAFGDAERHLERVARHLGL